MPSPLAVAADRALEATVALSFTRVGIAARRRLFGFRPLGSYDLTGRTVVVTGANSGLGYATAEHLAGMGASLRLSVRSDAKGRETVDRLVAATGNDDITYGLLDLADLASVRAYAASVLDDGEPIDALVHNAGAMFGERAETVDGIERTLQVHVIGPFLLTSLLLDHLSTSEGARVITVTSGGMYAEKLRTSHLQSEHDYAPATAYARAKRAQVVLNRLWARGDAGPSRGAEGIRFHAVHPGWAETPGVAASLPTFDRVVGPLLRTPAEGADTTAWLVADDEPLRSNGDLWHDRRRRSEHKLPTTRHDPAEEAVLWAEISRLAGAP